MPLTEREKRIRDRVRVLTPGAVDDEDAIVQSAINVVTGLELAATESEKIRTAFKAAGKEGEYRQLQNYLESKTEGLAAAADEESLGLGSFFSEVSNSLVDAAGDLDDKSLERLRDRPRGIPPAVYYIPRLEASVKASFRRSKKSGLNVLLYSRGSSEENLRESTVTLEVAAVPPAPGEEQPGGWARQVPDYLVVDLVPSGGERQVMVARLLAIRDALLASPSDPEPSRGRVSDPASGSEFDFLIEKNVTSARDELAEMTDGELLIFRLAPDAASSAEGIERFAVVRRPDLAKNFIGFYEVRLERIPDLPDSLVLNLLNSKSNVHLPGKLLAEIDGTFRRWLSDNRLSLSSP